jgi:DinB superfamily
MEIPPAIPPDGKDWTWVLERPCPECGFDARQVRPDEVAPLLRGYSQEWADEALHRSGVRDRPSPLVWSPLEYACHIRDVFRLYDERLVLMLTQDDPLYPNWDQDATAVAERYGEQDPARVGRELEQAGYALADRFDGVTDWGRPGRRSDGARFDIGSFARYLLHDVHHHLQDVRERSCGR